MLRVTVFPSSDPGTAGQLNWWENAVGEAPEVRTSEPRSLKNRETGSFGDGALTLSTEPQRIDWVYHPQGREGGGQDAKSLGSLETASETLLDLVRTWLANSLGTLDVRRLAMGTKLLQSVESLEDAQDKLVGYLRPFKFDKERDLDLLLRVNRTTKSEVSSEELRINRLSTWSIKRVMTLFVSVDQTTAQKLPLSPPTFACSLELDINTDKEADLSTTSVKPVEVLDELLQYGMEIAATGVPE